MAIPSLSAIPLPELLRFSAERYHSAEKGLVPGCVCGGAKGLVPAEGGASSANFSSELSPLTAPGKFMGSPLNAAFTT